MTPQFWAQTAKKVHLPLINMGKWQEVKASLEISGFLLSMC